MNGGRALEKNKSGPGRRRKGWGDFHKEKKGELKQHVVGGIHASLGGLAWKKEAPGLTWQKRLDDPELEGRSCVGGREEKGKRSQ